MERELGIPQERQFGMERKGKTEGVRGLWDRYELAALVVLIGAALLLWPSGSDGTPKNAAPAAAVQSAAEVQTEMEEILGNMAGVGQVRVMLTADSDGERQLAQDTELSYSGSAAAPEDYSAAPRRWYGTAAAADENRGDPDAVSHVPGALGGVPGRGRAEVRLAVTEAVAH